ncbi:hypothetical protein EV361DRAFT_488619 [Lentinula raphanica]|nr:hypothetical protein EV361DRAFT_488619 [Lentinula raphanica]
MSNPLAMLHLQSHIYVQRSFSLWKNAKIIERFTETITSQFSSLPSSLPFTARRDRFNELYTVRPAISYHYDANLYGITGIRMRINRVKTGEL